MLRDGRAESHQSAARLDSIHRLASSHLHFMPSLTKVLIKPIGLSTLSFLGSMTYCVKEEG